VSTNSVSLHVTRKLVTYLLIYLLTFHLARAQKSVDGVFIETVPSSFNLVRCSVDNPVARRLGRLVYNGLHYSPSGDENDANSYTVP